VNKGFAQVKFLNLKMLSTENYDVTSATEAYVGNLDSDSSDSQDFQIQDEERHIRRKYPP